LVVSSFVLLSSFAEDPEFELSAGAAKTGTVTNIATNNAITIYDTSLPLVLIPKHPHNGYILLIWKVVPDMIFFIEYVIVFLATKDVKITKGKFIQHVEGNIS
jgi:hypothetical protein